MAKYPTKFEITDIVATLHQRIIGALPNFPPPPQRFTIDLMKFLGWSRNDYERFFSRRAEASRDAAAAIANDPAGLHARTGYIPQITHKIWVTDPASPRFPPEAFVTAYCVNLLSFPPGWTHIFWSNSRSVRDYVSSFAKASGASVLFCDVDDLPLTQPVITAKRLIEARKFVLSTDVLRMVVVHHMGGIYSDFGITFRTVVPAVLRLHEYCLVFVHSLFFQSSVVGSAAGSDLLSLFLAIISRPEAFDRLYAVGAPEDAVEAIDEVEMLAGLGWTACTVFFLPETVKQAYVYSGGEIEWQGLQSWYVGGGKLGNIVIHNTQPTVVQDENFSRYTAEANEQIVCEHLRDNAVREGILILLKVRPYFTTNPTRLCRSIDYYGLPNTRGRDGYSDLLNYILWKFVDQNPVIVDYLSDFEDIWQEHFRGCAIAASSVSDDTAERGVDIWFDNAESFSSQLEPYVQSKIQSVRTGGFYILEAMTEAQTTAFELGAHPTLSYVILRNRGAAVLLCAVS